MMNGDLIKLDFMDSSPVKGVVISDIHLLIQCVESKLVGNILHVSKSIVELLLLYYLKEILKDNSSLRLALPELIDMAASKKVISPHTLGFLSEIVKIKSIAPVTIPQVSDFLFQGIETLSRDLSDHFKNKHKAGKKL